MHVELPMTRSFLALCLAVLSVAGCNRFDLSNINCVSNNDCAVGQTCLAGTCSGAADGVTLPDTDADVTPDTRPDGADLPDVPIDEGGSPDGTPPTVESLFPRVDRLSIQPDIPIRIVFSEPVDPASVTTETVPVIPDGPIDGDVLEGSLPGTWSVDGAEATFVPERGRLFEYGTAYSVRVTRGVTDLSGEAFAGESTFSLRTRTLQPAVNYRIRRASDGQVITVVEDGERLLLTLSAPENNTPDTHLQVIGLPDDQYSLGQRRDGVLYFVEGGDGNGPAELGTMNQSLFTGQVWNFTRRNPRADARSEESPTTYQLSTEWQGSSRRLGVVSLPGAPRLGIVNDDTASEQWWFERVDLEPVPRCTSDGDCAPYTCWTPWEVCLFHCFGDDPFCGNAATCNDVGICE